MALAAGTIRIPPFLTSQSLRSQSWPFTVAATPKKLSSSSTAGRFDSKNRRKNASLTTTRKEQLLEDQRIDEIPESSEVGDASSVSIDDGFVMPDLPGEEPDFWEGPQWDGLGFFVQYMWAFGIVFALIACGIAVATYNEGATDFKKTPVYKESLQTQELLEGPDESNSEVFEANPTEQAPPLE